jgi:peptidoglycan hydrolase-like protein with peptidoglycan-binding domain
MIKRVIIYFLILAISFSTINLSFAQKNNNGNKNNCIFLRDLKIGSKGNDVKCLQQYLRELNLFKHKPTGYYNLFTKRAVLEWQKINGLKPTGIFDINSRLKYYLTLISQKKEETNFSSIIQNNQIFIPNIDDKDIILDNNSNIATFEDYFKFYLLNILTRDDFKKLFNNYFKNEPLFKNGEPLLPEFLISNALKSEQFDKEILIAKTIALKEITEKKFNTLKQTKIHSNLKEIHKLVIYSEFINLDILNKFLDYLNNKINKQEMELSFKNYQESLKNLQKNFFSILFSKKINSLNFTDKIFNTFAYLFFVPLKTFAQIIPEFFIPFGGKILSILPCPCSGSNLVIVGPPMSATLFVPWTFLSHPLLYMYKNIFTPGVYVLGLYFTSAILPCMVPVPSGCALSGSGNLIYMAGTSLIPSLF